MTGRERRLEYEYDTLMARLGHRSDIIIDVTGRREGSGVPDAYRVTYLIRSICTVEDMENLGKPGVVNRPVFHDRFVLSITIPPDYPCIDASPVFRFLTEDGNGNPIPHPWHPNIRWFGEFAGRVCVNTPDTYTDIEWCVRRIAGYLKYEKYHALNEPPYPEDQQVASWVIRQGEPNGWVPFNN